MLTMKEVVERDGYNEVRFEVESTEITHEIIETELEARYGDRDRNRLAYMIETQIVQYEVDGDCWRYAKTGEPNGPFQHPAYMPNFYWNDPMEHLDTHFRLIYRINHRDDILILVDMIGLENVAKCNTFTPVIIDHVLEEDSFDLYEKYRAA